MDGRLSVALLGGFEGTIDGQLLEGFDSDKVRALTAYLAVERFLHRREKLAGLFWPDLPEKRARHNLNHALYNLRQVIASKQGGVESPAEPSYLAVTR